MKQRLDYRQASPAAFQAMLGLEHRLLELVKTRVSQINGWNRLAIPFRAEAGHYRPGQHS
ncbi:hypothetical protein G7045_05885 [Acidovorax sp. HDW3]|uniref:hypothetical protein n=1 Tax=Acidovorax sp. HDW3 TaxID=2714923 RepID=UPI00140D13DF|nr:hypothetical protein G7045_05885 [Acidovorax sp. HDW3]